MNSSSLGCMAGSVSWVSDSGFLLRSWTQGYETEIAGRGDCWSLSLSSAVPHPCSPSQINKYISKERWMNSSSLTALRAFSVSSRLTGARHGRSPKYFTPVLHAHLTFLSCISHAAASLGPSIYVCNAWYVTAATNKRPWPNYGTFVVSDTVFPGEN